MDDGRVNVFIITRDSQLNISLLKWGIVLEEMTGAQKMADCIVDCKL